MVKVIGQRSRAPGWKTKFQSFRRVGLCRFTLSCLMTSCGVMVWRHVTSHCDVILRLWARKRRRKAWHGRARRQSGVFIIFILWVAKIEFCFDCMISITDLMPHSSKESCAYSKWCSPDWKVSQFCCLSYFLPLLYLVSVRSVCSILTTFRCSVYHNKKVLLSMFYCL